MFEQSTIPKGPRRWWTTGVSLGGEALVMAVLAVAPMIWPDAIPRAILATTLAMPGAPPAPPPRGSAARPHVHNAVMRVFRADALRAPSAIPLHAVAIVDPPPEAGSFGVEGGNGNGPPNAILDGVIGGVPSDAPPPTVKRAPEPVKPTPPAPAPVQRLVIPGGKVNPAVAIFRPDPVYPPIARTMRVSGVVELRGVIGTDGRIKELRVVRGHPLLAQAALEAVSRWVYKPTLLNDRPVEVEAPITVTFRLN